MRVADLMSSSPVTVPADAGVEKAILLMDAHEIRHLVVVEGSVVVGVISDRDLLEFSGWHAPESTPRQQTGRQSVRDIMHVRPVTASPETTVIEAASHFVTDRIGCIPVISDDHLVGIVTERDLLTACTNRHGEDAKDPPVSELMTGSPESVGVDETLDEATERCRSAGLRHLPVLDGDRVVGVLSDRDLRRAHGLGRHGEAPVQEFMTKDVVTIAPDHGVREAARCMNELVISCLPVTDGTSLVGILSLEDLVYHCMLELSGASSER